jgi:anti-sigma B factor antagonist
MALDIKARVTGDTVTLDLAGRLWVLDLPLQDQVRELNAEGCRFFILNLEAVDYMDSSGLGQLVSIWTSVRRKDGNINLLRPTARVRRLLATTGLQVIFDVFEDEEKARTAVRRDWPDQKATT